MISMPVIESIRDMSRRGVSNAEIQRRTGVSQPTIRKYLAMKDFSPEMPQATRRTSILDPYKPFVDADTYRGRARVAQAASHGNQDL